MINISIVPTDGYTVVDNAYVYGMDNAIIGSKYPMLTDTSRATEERTNTVNRLATCKTGTGHDTFLQGIIAQFDLNFTIKAWVEAERYHFFDFISSTSTMHRVAQMDFNAICNTYVDANTVDRINKLRDIYLVTKSPEDYLRLLYNIPTGMIVTAKMTTNYRQLKTIYQQRKDHRLPEWREFCKWLETFPNAHFITG